MPPGETNMADELRVDERRSLTNRHIVSVAFSDGQVTENEDICEGFQSYFQMLFTRDPGLSAAQFNASWVDFHSLEVNEAAICQEPII